MTTYGILGSVSHRASRRNGLEAQNTTVRLGMLSYSRCFFPRCKLVPGVPVAANAIGDALSREVARKSGSGRVMPSQGTSDAWGTFHRFLIPGTLQRATTFFMAFVLLETAARGKSCVQFTGVVLSRRKQVISSHLQRVPLRYPSRP